MKWDEAAMYSVLGVVAGFISIISAIIWWIHLNSHKVGLYAMAKIGPAVLLVAGLFILALAGISIVAALLKAKHDIDDGEL